MKITSQNFYIKIYLITLFIFASYFLFQKYNNSVEWTISEWLINYQGGFTRRGLIGEIIFYISKLTSSTLRETILVFQILSYFFYYYLIFKFIKKIDKNLLLIFAIFSPLFLIYPIAEVEVLARKEIFLFISFLLIANIFSNEKIYNKHYFYFSLILSILMFIWEGIFFYLPFFIFILLIKNNLILNKLFIIKLILSFLPILMAFYLVIFFRLSADNLKLMCESVNECYGAMTYLNRDLQSNIGEVTSKFKYTYLFRYILIFIIGFFPLILLLIKSSFNSKFKSKNIVLIAFFILFIPTLLFYYIAQDWGRWINISYTLSLLTYIFCLKNNLIIFKNYNYTVTFLKNKSILIFIFIIFSFGWSPKTLINEDVGSIPIYRKSLIIIKSIDFKWWAVKDSNL